MPPHPSASGKPAFLGALWSDAPPDIELTRLVEEDDIVVAQGSVQTDLRGGGRVDALFCDVCHFRDDKICRLVTYQVDRGRASD